MSELSLYNSWKTEKCTVHCERYVIMSYKSLQTAAIFWCKMIALSELMIIPTLTGFSEMRNGVCVENFNMRNSLICQVCWIPRDEAKTSCLLTICCATIDTDFKHAISA